MQVQKYPLGQLQANCYFLIKEKKCLIIDPSEAADFISEKIQRENLQLVGLLATHGHFDHIMAAGELQLSYDVPFYIQEKDNFLVKRLNETARYFLGYDPAALIPKNIEFFVPGEFQISNFKFQILKTPGHTPGSCCFYFPKTSSTSSTIFTGDTLFKQGIGRYDFSYSDKDLLMKSLQTILNLPEDTTVYPGHGEETVVGDEARHFS